MTVEICGLCRHFVGAKTTNSNPQGAPKTQVSRTVTGLSSCGLSGLYVKYGDPSCRQAVA